MIPMSKTVPIKIVRWGSFVFWWGVTLVTLILLDDLLFGPIFWLLSQVDRAMATAAAFCASFAFQVWTNWAGLRPNPGRVAQFFINRLMIARKKHQIVEREESLRRQIISGSSALGASLLVGGVIPIIFLHRKGVLGIGHLRRLALMTSAIYATEFALIHGGYGLGAVLGWLV
jgi:hypothetical protein